ncbi:MULTISPECIES: hypothetical protein [unclassified Roseateles]|uniref:hypothetical protein n=1 Tax=unclassified Roseateles TaxID=2626991 RepID=UPI0012E341A0|nr:MULTISPECIES: hypothetical protein [unclassified Roseateles]
MANEQRFLTGRSAWVIHVLIFMCIAVGAFVMFPINMVAPAVDIADVRYTDGKAACIPDATKYGPRGDYEVDGIRYYGRYTKLGGLTMRVCNVEANGLKVRIGYLIEKDPPHRRLLVGIWRLSDGVYLETMAPEEKKGLWQRQFWCFY